MKIALINDIHFDARSSAIWMQDYQKKFYDTIFFPYLKANNIKVVLNGGDTFDDRKEINILSLRKSKRMFFDPLKAAGIKMYMIPGNHDVHFKNVNDVSSINELLTSYDNIEIIEEPKTLKFEEVNITMLPWLNNSNYHDFMRYVQKDNAEFLYGHLELAGFEMHSGIKNEHGMDRALFKKYKEVWTGHFHQPSEQDNIKYLGAPTEFSWADYGCPRGFSVFDTDTQQVTFVRNPHTLFEKIFYDENTIDERSFPYNDYKGKFVQVHVSVKTDLKKYDKFIDTLYKVDTIDLVVYDTTLYVNITPTSFTATSSSTRDLMNDYVDNINDNTLEKDEIKKILDNLYLEASVI